MCDGQMTKMRIAQAFAVSPLLVPLVFSVPALLTRHSEDVSTTLLFFSIYGLPIAYIAEAVLGLPMWLVFSSRRVQSLVAFALAGAVIGLLVDLSWKLWSNTPNEWVNNDPLFALAAMGSAVTFRLIAVPAGSPVQNK